jgi:hypothetical protein
MRKNTNLDGNPLLPVLQPQPQLQPTRRISLAKKITWGVGIVAVIGGLAALMSYATASTPLPRRPSSPDDMCGWSSWPHRPPGMPPLTYADAANAVVNGSVKAILYTDCDSDSDWRKPLLTHVFWAQNLHDERYTYLARILGHSAEEAREKALLYLDEFATTFPQQGEQMGCLNNIDEPPKMDCFATDYAENNIPKDNPPGCRSLYETPFFVSSNSTLLVPEASLPERSLIQKLNHTINRHRFHKSHKPPRDRLQITPEQMADSVFAQSNVARKLR